MTLPVRPRRHQNTAPGPLVTIEEATRCVLPETEDGWAAQEKLKKIDACDLAHDLGPVGFSKWLDESPAHVVKWPENGDDFIAAQSILRAYPEMRRPVIHGLLRETETCNIVAAPKMNKSFLVGNIALNIIGGGKLFGRFQCERGRVGIIDNELHCETIASRLRELAPALNVPLDRVGRLIDYSPLRGTLLDIYQLEEKIAKIRYKTYKVIILDALYKFYPADGFDESDNAAMARLYTQLDAYAEYTGSAFILIHHASKGDQSGKDVTDIGAGAGAQSRACDAHMTLRRHEEGGIYVIDCANRSFPPIQRFCARFKFPVWEGAEDKDPEAMAGLQKKRPVGRPPKNPGGATERPTAPQPASAPAGAKPETTTKIDPAQHEAARQREFFAAMGSQPITAREVLETARRFKLFSSWTIEHLETKVLPEMIAQGVISRVSCASGERSATYAAVAPETTQGASDLVPKEVFESVDTDFHENVEGSWWNETE